MITTRTSDRLARIALELTAMTDAIYQAGHREIAHQLSTAQNTIAHVAVALENDIEAGARAMMRDDAPAHPAEKEGERS